MADASRPTTEDRARLAAVPRNDLDACQRYYESRGELRAGELVALAELQDDHRTLARHRRAHGWIVVSEQPDQSMLDRLDEEPLLEVRLVDVRTVKTWVPAPKKCP